MAEDQQAGERTEEERIRASGGLDLQKQVLLGDFKKLD